MRTSRVTMRLARDEGGATIVMVALFMVVLLSAVALAIDVGILLTARAEAQRAADSAALAGAGELILAPELEDPARATAIAYGAMNNILGDAPVILPEDVEVDLDQRRVRVTVFRTAERGSAVPTWFARVFGVNEVDVSAVAAAGIFPGGGGICLKPWAIMDGFLDSDGDGYWTEGLDTYEGYEYGTVPGSDWRNGTPEGCCFDADIGRLMMIKPGNPSAAIQPGWFFPWRMPLADGELSSGGDDYRDNIVNCNGAEVYTDDGSQYWVEPGNMIGPTKQGVEELIARDPYAEFDPVTNSVINSAYEVSPRIIYVPAFEPMYDLEQGAKPLEFTNIIGLFLVGTEGNDVVARLMYASGIPGSGEGEGEGTLYPALIE